MQNNVVRMTLELWLVELSDSWELWNPTWCQLMIAIRVIELPNRKTMQRIELNSKQMFWIQSRDDTTWRESRFKSDLRTSETQKQWTWTLKSSIWGLRDIIDIKEGSHHSQENHPRCLEAGIPANISVLGLRKEGKVDVLLESSS